MGIQRLQFISVAQSCPTLCDPMNRSMPGLPVHHQLAESTQTHRVNDAIQPSHPLSSPSPPALNLSQHQSQFKWVSSLHQKRVTCRQNIRNSCRLRNRWRKLQYSPWKREDLCAIQGYPGLHKETTIFCSFTSQNENSSVSLFIHKCRSSAWKPTLCLTLLETLDGSCRKRTQVSV